MAHLVLFAAKEWRSLKGKRTNAVEKLSKVIGDGQCVSLGQKRAKALTPGLDGCLPSCGVLFCWHEVNHFEEWNHGMTVF